ncbi:MAG: hypothetical protein IMW95_11820 [Moorella humiferrea]|nr:hypothetical protein [Moorella humiferrea]
MAIHRRRRGTQDDHPPFFAYRRVSSGSMSWPSCSLGRLPQVLGIGLVAAAVCQLTTKSLLPYLNFASEPVGAIVTALLLYLPFDKNSFFRVVKPLVVTFLGTFASGFTYITIFKAITLFATLPKNPAYTYLLMVVIVTGIFNAVLAQVLYFPLKQLLKNV